MDAPPPLPAQDMMVKPMKEIITNNTTTKAADINTCVKRKVPIRPEKDLKPILNCPRCNSSNTKFCYYNNYSLTQPRYFCKTCKRYWTQGGSLRNIPVGGKIRKNKTHSPNCKIKLPDQLLDQHPSSINPNYPKSLIHHAQDLNLGNFTTSTHHLLHHPYDDHHIHHKINNTYNNNTSNYLSAMELLTGINNDASSRGSVMAPFMPIQHISDPNPNAVYPVGFPLQGDFRPSLSFSLDGSKAADDDHQDQDQDHISDQQITRDRGQHEDSTGYWTGNILGGAGSW